MPSSKIITPFGEIIRRIVIEIDHAGKTRMITADLTLPQVNGSPAQMNALEAAHVLSKCEVDVLGFIVEQSRNVAKNFGIVKGVSDGSKT